LAAGFERHLAPYADLSAVLEVEKA
jgi:hypothetical protein